MASSSRTTYERFARTVQSYQEGYSDPGPSTQLDSPLRHDVVLNKDGGLLISLMKTIEEAVRAGTGSSSTDMEMDEQLSDDLRSALLQEHRTWQLLRTVYEHRLHWKSFDPNNAYDETVMEKDPYTPAKDICDISIDVDEELSFFATLVEHLQSRPLLNTAIPLEARHGYLPTTLRRTKNAQLTGVTSGPGGLLTPPPSLDPDFTLRDSQGSGLAGEDASYQGPLMDTLWDLIRHGELDAAIRTCERGGEPWRGATLMGGRRWTMGGLSKDKPDSMASEGNRTRLLWKKTCRAIAKNPLLSHSERATYAALISDLPTLLPACRSFEDHLWAHLSARLESKLEIRYRDIGGFWEEESSLVGQDSDFTPVTGGINEIFATMSQTQDPAIAIAFRDPYYVAQRFIIQGKTDLLLDQFADRLPLEGHMSTELIGPLLRFFTHLVLILRALGQAVSDTAANIIIEAYLHVLEQEGSDSLVAMYAACLRDGNGEESYARFLRSMDPEASKEMKAEALSRAKQHNLDIAAIARETVRLILEAAFAEDVLDTSLPDVDIFAIGLSEEDVYLIRSIEWLSLVPDTKYDALERANEIIRHFLARGQANAAHALLKSLPAGVSKFSLDTDVAGNVMEHEQVLALFGVFAHYEIVDEILSNIPKATASKVEQHNWRKGLGNAIERTRNATIQLLTSDWLSFPFLDKDISQASSYRQSELQRIRQIYIPELILRLHNLLISNSKHFPQYVETALDLTKVVAKDENALYADFFTPDNGRAGSAWKLELYLDKIREASLMLLARGGDSVFSTLAN